MRTTESLLSIHSMLRDKMAFFVHRAPCSVGILLSRSFDSPKHILVYVRSASDLRLLPYARTMAENNQATLRIVLSTGVARESLNSHPGEEIIETDKLCSVPTECDLVVRQLHLLAGRPYSCEELLAQLPLHLDTQSQIGPLLITSRQQLASTHKDYDEVSSK